MGIKGGNFRGAPSENDRLKAAAFQRYVEMRKVCGDDLRIIFLKVANEAAALLSAKSVEKYIFELLEATVADEHKAGVQAADLLSSARKNLQETTASRIKKFMRKKPAGGLGSTGDKSLDGSES